MLNAGISVRSDTEHKQLGKPFYWNKRIKIEVPYWSNNRGNSQCQSLQPTQAAVGGAISYVVPTQNLLFVRQMGEAVLIIGQQFVFLLRKECIAGRRILLKLEGAALCIFES